MQVDEIKGALATAVAMRPPKFDEALPAARKVAELTDYLLESAFMQAELEEALFWLDRLVAEMQAKVEQISGYEAVLPAKRSERITKEDVLRAKRTIDPVTFEAGAEAKALRVSVLRQIDRFRFEAGNGPVSRAYTMISGG